ncbi:hypothetical protein F5B22DRAFT_642472 [Xylaria bambusicola]|uniref:uncharacterized protein n=1 Tax=Xylaria bambusicola TaxID=326684 RepID=UPI002008741B|nr:uncharacterized protein F5B22DRAFT_642472 [Xylaria bambusicola]KAI0525453.1 hypothetical protein F5B22DRAFT_642472 [Xylaria bambusicola]
MPQLKKPRLPKERRPKRLSQKFLFFKSLPTELRLAIWETAILDHNEDRFLPVSEDTKRIIPTWYLACSPHFYVSHESREVAKRLYPIRLRISAPITSLTTDIYGDYDDDDDDDKREKRKKDIDIDDSRPWAIYISLKHDIFVLVSNKLSYKDLVVLHNSQRLAVTRRRSESLTTLQTQCVRQLMLLNIINKSQLKNECAHLGHCIVTSADSGYNGEYNRDMFSGVERCLALYLDPYQAHIAYVSLLDLQKGIFGRNYDHHDDKVLLRNEPISKFWEMGKFLDFPCRR